MATASSAAYSQTGGRRGSAPSVQGPVSNPGSQEESPDNSLEVPPRILTPPQQTAPGETDSEPAPPSPAAESTPVPRSGPPVSELAAPAERPLPYLGVSVQYIESHAIPGRDIEGIEVIGVDPGSPADRAGLRGRGTMTTLGASGATAGALMAPLDIVVMPLLKKTGQLGGTGDLIVAIDDKRVHAESDLKDALASMNPGDTVYFTIKRAQQDGSVRTLTIPVKLASSARAASPDKTSAANSLRVQ